MATEFYDISRHSEVINPSKHKRRVHIVGVGATGSALAYELGKIGWDDLVYYDDDQIESHNIGNQRFARSQTGMKKVDATTEMLKWFMGDEINPVGYDRRIEKEGDFEFSGQGDDIVFVLTDTIESRLNIVELCSDSAEVSLIVETRMGVGQWEVYGFNPMIIQEANAWRETIPPDGDNAYEELSACGSPLSVGATASGLAAEATWMLIMALAYPKMYDFCRTWNYRGGSSTVRYCTDRDGES